MLRKFIFLLVMSVTMLSANATQNIGVLFDEQDASVRHKDAKIAIQMWVTDVLAKEYNGEIKVQYYEHKKDALDDFVSGKIQYLSLGGWTYLDNRDMLEKSLLHKYAFYRGRDQATSFMIVSANDPAIRTLKDLKNKRFGIRQDSYTEFLFINHSLLSQGQHEYKKFFKEIQTYDNHSTVLLKLFFGKLDACNVPKFEWETMKELNPQIGKKLKVLYASDDIFIPYMALINKNADPNFVEVHGQTAKMQDSNMRVRQILTLLKVDRYEPVDETTVMPMVDFYEAYQMLKVKYSAK